MDRLEPPRLPDHLRGGEDGPSGSEEEVEAKGLRSASTTPRSASGTDPDEYDRVMGISSVAQETDRYGEGNVIDLVLT